MTSTTQPTGLHRIAAVARRTGVSEHALRIWERRYGALASHRSESGYRLYTESDVARIGLLKQLVDAGYSIGDVAPMSADELDKLRERVELRGAAVPPSRALADRTRTLFLTAIERVDATEATRIAMSAATTFPPLELITEIVAPLLREVGERWRANIFTIAQEHLASAILRARLNEILTAARPSEGAQVVIATTPPSELHEIGALIAAVVAATAGARIVYLGPNTPPEDVATAAARSGAGAVILSIVGLDDNAARAAVEAQRKALPREIEMWVGGASIRTAPVPGVRWVQSLDELRDRARPKSVAAQSSGASDETKK